MPRVRAAALAFRMVRRPVTTKLYIYRVGESTGIRIRNPCLRARGEVRQRHSHLAARRCSARGPRSGAPAHGMHPTKPASILETRVRSPSIRWCYNASPTRPHALECVARKDLGADSRGPVRLRDTERAESAGASKHEQSGVPRQRQRETEATRAGEARGRGLHSRPGQSATTTRSWLPTARSTDSAKHGQREGAGMDAGVRAFRSVRLGADGV